MEVKQDRLDAYTLLLFTTSYQPQQLQILSKLLTFAPALFSHSHLPTALRAPLQPIIVFRATPCIIWTAICPPYLRAAWGGPFSPKAGPFAFQ